MLVSLMYLFIHRQPVGKPNIFLKKLLKWIVKKKKMKKITKLT